MRTFLLTLAIALFPLTASAQYHQQGPFYTNPYTGQQAWDLGWSPRRQHRWELERIRAYGQGFGGHHNHSYGYRRPYNRQSRFQQQQNHWELQQSLQDIEYQLWRQNRRTRRW